MQSILVASDAVLEMLDGRCARRITVSSLHELRQALELYPAADGPRSLDLIGHSTRGARFLRLGTSVVDFADLGVKQFFENLVGTLGRLRIVKLRLLGCATAAEPGGQRTIRSLARTLQLQVYGARKPLSKTHYDAEGFNPMFANILVESTQLPNPPRRLQ